MFEPYQAAELTALGCLDKARAMVAAGSDPEAAFIACRKAARAAAKAGPPAAPPPVAVAAPAPTAPKQQPAVAPRVPRRSAT